MSGIFKGQMGKDDLRKGTSYKPGERPYDLNLVSEIVERCGIIPLGEYDEAVAFIRSAVPKQIDTFEHFDPDAFLEAIVLGWRQNVSYMNLNQAIMSSVKGLYDAGIDTFRIDLRTVPEQLFFMVSRLDGTEERPMNITCLGKGKSFGGRVSYCHLVLEGYAEAVGENAKSSVFDVRHSEPAPNAVGWYSEDSSYYAASMRALPFVYRGHDEGIFLATSDRCRFYVEGGITMPYMLDRFSENGFWRRENSLYVPDGRCGWNRVVPFGSGNWEEVPEG